MISEIQSTESDRSWPFARTLIFELMFSLRITRCCLKFSEQPRAKSFRSSWSAVGKQETLESSVSKAENIGLPVKSRMPCRQTYTLIESLEFYAPSSPLSLKSIKRKEGTKTPGNILISRSRVKIRLLQLLAIRISFGGCFFPSWSSRSGYSLKHLLLLNLVFQVVIYIYCISYLNYYY